MRGATPVYEERQETSTVSKPVKEVYTKEIPSTVCKPVCVTKPVHYTKMKSQGDGRMGYGTKEVGDFAVASPA